MNKVSRSGFRAGTRRPFRRLWLIAAAWALLALDVAARPNVVLIMADDLGWGDVGFNGNRKVKTPALDQLAREGVRLNRFYAGGPVCTPTRATCMTGRSPNRYGAIWAGRYPLPPEEITVAEVLRDAGYRTGFFGKWHLGKLTPARDEGFPAPKLEPRAYLAPWHQGFETCFATESAVPNYNPEVWIHEWNLGSTASDANVYVMNRPIRYGEGTLVGDPLPRWPYRFWHGEGKPAAGPIAGDSSELIMNHAVRFIERSVEKKEPFLAVVWFVTPHTPVSAGDEARSRYAGMSMQEQHWFGAISALDDQVARLRTTLRKLDVEEDTLLWFCSDNGPSWVHDLNSAGPLRGKKGELYEGGIRVPSVVSWPAGIKGGREISVPLSTADFLPTIAAAANLPARKSPPLDGENVLPVLQGKASRRSSLICFEYPVRESAATWEAGATRQLAVMDGDWKLVSVDSGKSFQLYNLPGDIGETSDQASARPEEVSRLWQAFAKWRSECAASLEGADYK
jgi:arylsulfatase A-like enzyme